MIDKYRRYITLLAIFFLGTVFSPLQSAAQSANFHPCNAQPALPICQSGYGKKIAMRRWGSKSAAMDKDAVASAALKTDNPAQEIKNLKSESIFIVDLDTGNAYYKKNEDTPRAIASITKLMTALLILQAELAMDELITIDTTDINLPSTMPSRLKSGKKYSRIDLLKVMLLASENSAAHALARTYPGGLDSFITSMNLKAYELGMIHTSFADVSGLSSQNISTARDLSILVAAAAKQPMIKQLAGTESLEVSKQIFNNTNILVGRKGWDIVLSKTGTTTASGDCLVMVFNFEEQHLAMILLDANGASGVRFGDAVRLRRIIAANN